jgi:hypothetical protein
MDLFTIIERGMPNDEWRDEGMITDFLGSNGYGSDPLASGPSVLGSHAQSPGSLDYPETSKGLSARELAILRCCSPLDHTSSPNCADHHRRK